MTVLVNIAGGSIDVPDAVVDDYLQQGWVHAGESPLGLDAPDDEAAAPAARKRRSSSTKP